MTSGEALLLIDAQVTISQVAAEQVMELTTSTLL